MQGALTKTGVETTVRNHVSPVGNHGRQYGVAHEVRAGENVKWLLERHSREDCVQVGT